MTIKKKYIKKPPAKQKSAPSNFHTSLFSYVYSPLENLFQSDFVDFDKEKDFIPFGEDNLLPQQIVQLSRSVAVHRAIINSKSNFIAGSSISSPNLSMQAFLDRVDYNSHSFHSKLNHVIFDDLMMGNAFFELVTDANFSFLEFFHIDASTCRKHIDNASIIFHPNWRNYKGPNDPLRTTLPIYPNFQEAENGSLHSIYHIKTYEPEFSNYGLPKWYAGLSSVIITGLTDRWNQDRLESQFNSDGMLVIPGVNSAEEGFILQEKLNQFSGATTTANKNNLLVQFLTDLGPGQVRDNVQYIPFPTNSTGNWLDLHAQSYNNLLSIHNWFKSLCSFFGEKTGFDTQRILNEYEVALKTVIKQWQQRYLAILRPIFQSFGFNTDELDFENQPPVYRINPVAFVWEVRKDAGLSYDENDPVQNQLFAQLQNTFSSDKENQTENVKPNKNI